MGRSPGARRGPRRLGACPARARGGGTRCGDSGQRAHRPPDGGSRSEEHTSELQSLMRISYAVFCLKKKTKKTLKGRSNTRIHTNYVHISPMPIIPTKTKKSV